MALLSNLYPGIKGAQGIQGTTGAQGTQGTQGIQGIQGVETKGFSVTEVNGPYSLQTSDVGKLIKINSGISTVSISSNTFSFGNSFMVYNGTSNTQTISQGVGVSFYSGDGTAAIGNKTINENEITTILCSSSNDEFIFSGVYTNIETIDIVRDGLVLLLDAGDTESYPGSGTTWYDLSGDGRNATINGSPTFTDGYFDITSDSTYISLSNSGLVPRTNDFTYSTWINFDAPDSLETIVENGSWTDTLLFRYQTNLVAVYAEGALRGNFSWTASAGVWYNVVFKRESGTCSMYINNTLTGTPFTMTTDINLANTNLFLMRSQHTTGQFFNGKISTFSIYNKSLTSSEIEQNFEALRERFGV